MTAVHRAKNAARMRAYRAAHPERVAAQQRAYRLRHKAKESERTWKYRGLPLPTRPNPGLCECCGRGRTKKRALNNDHCHATNTFRGWLCSRCNTYLGSVGDTLDGVKRHARQMIAYLERAA